MSDSTQTPATSSTPEFTSPEQLLELATRLDDQMKELKLLSNDVKKALKNCSKLAKNGAFTKKKKQKKVRDPNAPPRAPAGFARPTKLSAELCDFLGVSRDTAAAFRLPRGLRSALAAPRQVDLPLLQPADGEPDGGGPGPRGQGPLPPCPSRAVEQRGARSSLAGWDGALQLLCTTGDVSASSRMMQVA